MPVLTDVAPGVSPALSLEREELFPIREVSRLTGVNPVTLRAWERRYGLIVPTRTESGHRLYSMQDIERVRSILNWIERGVAVSKIGNTRSGNVKVIAAYNRRAQEAGDASVWDGTAEPAGRLRES